MFRLDMSIKYTSANKAALVALRERHINETIVKKPETTKGGN